MKKNKTLIYIVIAIVVIIIGIFLASLTFYIKDTLEEKTVTSKDTFNLGEMSYKIPEGFEYDLEVNSDEDDKRYDYSKNSIYCNVQLYRVECDEYSNYTSGEEYIKERIYITLSDEIKTSSDGNWYTINIVNDHEITRKISAIKYNNSIYVYEYIFSDYTHGEESDTEEYKKAIDAYDYIYKSIKFQK